MNYHCRVYAFAFVTFLVATDSTALPRDELSTLCEQPGVFNVQVLDPNTGQRSIYWCDSGNLDPCPGNVCQPGEDINIEDEPSVPGSPWEHDCDDGYIWNPNLKRCVKLGGTPDDPGGGGSKPGSNKGDCKSIKNMLESHCVADFKAPPDPNWVRAKTHCCLSTEKCLEQWDKKEEAAGFTRNGRCMYCLGEYCKTRPKDKDIGPNDYKYQCNRLLTEQMERVAKIWRKDPKCRIVKDPLHDEAQVLEESQSDNVNAPKLYRPQKNKGHFEFKK